MHFEVRSIELQLQHRVQQRSVTMFVAGSRALRLVCRPSRAAFCQPDPVSASFSRRALLDVSRYSTVSEAAEAQKPASNVASHNGTKPTSVGDASTIASENAGATAELAPKKGGRTSTKGNYIRFVQSLRGRTPKTVEKDSSPGSAVSWRQMDSHIPIKVNGEIIYFEPLHLRDSCPCDRCIHPSTKQRTFETAQIPLDITAKSVIEGEDSFIIEWARDIKGFESHTSTFPASYLQKLTTVQLGSKPADPAYYWNKSTFEKTDHWISYDDYMNNPEAFRSAMMQLNRYGLLFLRGVPEDTESVSRVATQIGPIKNTLYGPTWDVRNIPNPKNVAYTNVDLGFHMDLLYLIQPPGLQFLHCMKNELPGGESLFADSFYAADVLRKTSKPDFDFLADSWMTFGYDNDNQMYTATRKMINVSGKSKDRIIDINYSPPFQAPFWEISNGIPKNTYTRRAESMKRFKSLLEDKKNIFELKMKPGECVIFHNRRVVHARRAFGNANNESGGDRWLRGCYIDSDVAVSKFKTLNIY
ncbi:Gamma-butyrobetaine hydroxylase subfamily protein, putative [Trichophyton benhamiae CBS 112371]|uniref:Gamma-butyrobetaine hydroxylase subfamily protein, putative n=1 Tax=Arthroderma benhamiae (strain ATCC MYA-4681 / CBS 112371) TaxID=663331 RepID=D4B1Q2_ARTBC|nr:Gamma-butyrobetaine hydroxylase subfamily protein, putative [Trichophyton benhamiae CBS 112371]EFE30684.1 Gamma-butyrobetaine hydroxylase subfamily protein, putative [Trichophyton benhamiae CBS 112371]